MAERVILSIDIKYMEVIYMNEIKIAKDLKGIVIFNYDGDDKPLTFENLKDFSKKLVKLDDIKNYNPSFVADDEFSLYVDAIKEIIQSIQNDQDLLDLLKE